MALLSRHHGLQSFLGAVQPFDERFGHALSCSSGGYRRDLANRQSQFCFLPRLQPPSRSSALSFSHKPMTKNGAAKTAPMARKTVARQCTPVAITSSSSVSDNRPLRLCALDSVDRRIEPCHDCFRRQGRSNTMPEAIGIPRCTAGNVCKSDVHRWTLAIRAFFVFPHSGDKICWVSFHLLSPKVADRQTDQKQMSQVQCGRLPLSQRGDGSCFGIISS